MGSTTTVPLGDRSLRAEVNDVVYKAVTAQFLTKGVGFDEFQRIDTEPYISTTFEHLDADTVDSFIADIAERAISGVMPVIRAYAAKQGTPDPDCGDLHKRLLDYVETEKRVAAQMSADPPKRKPPIETLFDAQANAIFGSDYASLSAEQRRSIKLMLHGAVYGATDDELQKLIEDDV